MRSKLLQFLFIFFAIMGQAQTAPALHGFDHAREAAHTISFYALTDDSFCSATAIGAHSLLTASHCELGSDLIAVDGVIANITAPIVRDFMDHSIITVDSTFAHWVSLKARPDAPQGTAAFMLGNPGELRGILRVGFLAAHDTITKYEVTIPRLLFDFGTYHGDSGAAIYDATTGEILTVTTGVKTVGENDEAIKFAFAFPILFTQKQLDAVK